MSRHLLIALLALAGASAIIPKEARIDCHPDQNANEKECTTRGCLWEPFPGDEWNTPSCYMKSDELGYTGTLLPDGSYKLSLKKDTKSPFGISIPEIYLAARDIGNGVINVRIDDHSKRYEPPIDLPKATIPSKGTLVFAAHLNDSLSFTISRSNTRKVFDTSFGGLIFADKFLQIAAYLPSYFMYGWGENTHLNIKHNFSSFLTWGMFARDELPNALFLDTKNLYGVHPFYLLVEPDGLSHGVLFLNSNAQEVTTTPKKPAIIYRTIGGILDMYFFPGPRPEDVIQQYAAFIGRPFLPPYWALGYQMCRYGYKNLDDLKTRVAAIRAYEIPFDVAYADINYMDEYKDFTIGKDWASFGDYMTYLHSIGMRTILIWDPAIGVDYETFERGVQMDASFIEWERADQVPRDVNDKYPLTKGSKLMLGVVWPFAHSAFPDFLDPTNRTLEWWKGEFVRFHQKAAFDGAWIDMNEPSVFGTNHDGPWVYDDPAHPQDALVKCPLSGPDSEYDVPPFQTAAVYRYGNDSYLSSNSLCMIGRSRRGTERLYDTKNLYGWSETKATQLAVQAATGKRAVVISRSTFPSSGRFGGHWLGDNLSSWEDLRASIIGIMEFNLFGIPYVGADVCGFRGNTTEELCLRWQQAAAFHSFFRNHNVYHTIYQDPAAWPLVAMAAKKANLFRYSYLPYLYSLHFRVSLYGGTVIHPTFFDFPEDPDTYELSEQFMWGSAILVAPVLYQGATTVTAYIPAPDYYSLYDSEYGQPVVAGQGDFAAPTDYNAPTFIRAGSIIPRQTGKVTTDATRVTPFSLLIVPSSSSLTNATGELYWDSGDSIISSMDTHEYQHVLFSFALDGSSSKLELNTARTATGVVMPRLASLELFAFPSAPSYASFTLNGKTLGIDTQGSRYNPFKKILNVAFTTPVDISQEGTQTVQWTFAKKREFETTTEET